MSESLAQTFSHIYNTLGELERMAQQPRDVHGNAICGEREYATNLICGIGPHVSTLPHSFKVAANQLEDARRGGRTIDGFQICGVLTAALDGPLACGMEPDHDGRHAWEPKKPAQPRCEKLGCPKHADYRINSLCFRCAEHTLTFPGKFMAERLNDEDAE